MKIVVNNIDYPCKCKPSTTMVYCGLPDEFPHPVNGEVRLCADDGFVIRTDNTADYLRQTFENGILTLTNVPEPVPTNEPEPTEPTVEERVATLEDAVCEMDAAYADQIAALEDAICDMDAANAAESEV